MRIPNTRIENTYLNTAELPYVLEIRKTLTTCLTRKLFESIIAGNVVWNFKRFPPRVYRCPTFYVGPVGVLTKPNTHLEIIKDHCFAGFESDPSGLVMSQCNVLSKPS